MEQKLKYEPWIKKISDFEKVPPEFAKEYHENNDYHFILLIPGNLNSYRYVVGVYDSFLYIIENKITGISSRKLHYKDIIYIKINQVLLKGLLEITAHKERIIINYNTVSDDIIEDLVKFIRKKNTYHNTLSKKYPLCTNIPDNAEFLYKNLFYRIQHKEDYITFLAYQPEVKLTTQITNRFLKLLTQMIDLYLSSYLYISNNYELIVISRNTIFKRGAKHLYGYSVTYIPFKGIIEVTEKPHLVFNTIKQMVLQFSNKDIKLFFSDNNPDYNKFMERVKP